MTDWNLVIRRFTKVFVFGGLGSLSVALAQAPTSLEQLKPWLVALGVAFIAGGIAAVEKALQ